jgi:3-oxoacyl-[acyl-carrier protein] reductase
MMKNRVVLITGASRGIGAATARLLAQCGAAVAVNFVENAAAAEGVVQDIMSGGGRAIAVQADVRVHRDVEDMVHTVGERLGPIDTLVLNAHIKSPIAPFLQHGWDEFEAKLTGEMKAAFYCVKAVVPGMLANKKGCIVAISSGVSQYPPAGACAHSVAKAALNALMRALALELGPVGIRVNTIAPGLIMTDNTAPLPEQFKHLMAGKTPLRRIGLPEDVAGAILMLVRDEAGFVTGNYLNVDGGMQIGQFGIDISAVNRSQVFETEPNARVAKG